MYMKKTMGDGNPSVAMPCLHRLRHCVFVASYITESIVSLVVLASGRPWWYCDAVFGVAVVVVVRDSLQGPHLL